MTGGYPEWVFYPNHDRAPPWVAEFVDVVAAVQPSIDSRTTVGLKSNEVLASIRPGLCELGYEVEASKSRSDRIRRPVLFGDRGVERVAYEVDAVEDELGVLLEVETARGADGNAVYRD